MALNYQQGVAYQQQQSPQYKQQQAQQQAPYQNAADALRSIQKTPGTPTTPSSQPQVQPLAAPQQATGSSPVTPNGKIAPATAPVAAPQPQIAPTQQVAPMAQGNNVEPGTGASHLNYPYSPYPTVNPAGAEEQQYANLMYLLQNPMTMTPDVVAQMKGANRDEAALMQKQLQDQLHQQTASRGLQVGGGWDNAQSRKLGEAEMQQILTGNRNIDIQSILQNRQDLMNALQTGSGMLGEAENRNLSAAQLALQRALGIGGLNIDRSRIGEQAREFNLGNQLNWASLMNNMVMGRAGYGLDLAQLQQQMQNGMFGRLFG